MKMIIVLLIILFGIGSLAGAYFLSHNKFVTNVFKLPSNLRLGIQLPSEDKGVLINQSNETITRTLTSTTTCENGLCTYQGYTEPINYPSGDSYLPINSTIVKSNGDYDYMVYSGLYKVYFKDNPSEENPVLVKLKSLSLDNQLDISMQPYSLIYKNDKGETQLIKSVQSVKGYPIQHIFPSEHIRFEALDTMFYPDIFGEGTNLTIEYDNTLLRKRLYVEPKSLPKPTINSKGLTLDLVFKINSNGWNKNLETFSKVPLEVNSEVLGFLKNPIATEKFHWIKDPIGVALIGNGNNTGKQDYIQSKYSFYNEGGDYFVSIRTNYSFINDPNLVSPFEIDPSIEIGMSTGWDDAGDVGSFGGGTFNNDSASYSIATGDSGTITKMGVMFREVMIPQGADITDGYMTVSTWAKCSARGGCGTRANGVNADDVVQWSSSNRPKDATLTTMGATLDVSGTDISNGQYVLRIYNDSNSIPKTYLYQSVENITNRTNWEVGNNMSFVLQQVSVGYGNNFLAYAYESGHPVATLYITYTDTTNPNVNLSSPTDESTDEDGNVTFECNATDNYMVNNLSLFTNFTGSWIANQSYIPNDMGRDKDTLASSTLGGYPSSLAVDGDTGTSWASDFGVLPNWIYVDMGNNYTINKVKIYWLLSYQSKDFYVQMSNDTVTWYNVSIVSSNTDYTTTHIFNNLTRYIRVYTTATDAALTSIEEIKIYQQMPYRFYVNGISNGYYKWNCNATDGSGNSGVGTSNWTITINAEAPSDCWTYDAGNKFLSIPSGCLYSCMGVNCPI